MRFLFESFMMEKGMCDEDKDAKQGARPPDAARCMALSSGGRAAVIAARRKARKA